MKTPVQGTRRGPPPVDRTGWRVKLHNSRRARRLSAVARKRLKESFQEGNALIREITTEAKRNRDNLLILPSFRRVGNIPTQEDKAFALKRARQAGYYILRSVNIRKRGNTSIIIVTL